MGMGEFNSHDHYIYYYGQEFLRRNKSSPHSQEKRSKCSTWVKLKNDRMMSVCFQGKPFIVTVIQVYAQTTNSKEAEVQWFYEELQDLLEHTKKMFFS